jgi:hypothetical protein
VHFEEWEGLLKEFGQELETPAANVSGRPLSTVPIAHSAPQVSLDASDTVECTTCCCEVLYLRTSSVECTTLHREYSLSVIYLTLTSLLPYRRVTQP